MGPYLTVPKKEKFSEETENSTVSVQPPLKLLQMKVGATGMQGWRNTMEDTHIVSLDLANGVSFFGVYDGHGGNPKIR